mmetsp:Transcript_23336/g.41712  ORF Transcript_23336/g.41712 Transcript_23336/m.41712 type:complete len:210 (-) Transcript_23336:199-828(-)|eukprot:CAMPEP_0205913620 /NCGR_PEP_ID=MMETSP1325-20131115/6661_1 /ASSEMBLY_ACC=CAM_ASM_000708 /TAXON_ID=236786 /ORGANISM="Florenciella sp., Strain RCC1007" /LENGTH=209 /DNA_ID=CAMNT_0053280519 /DNA_START=323 /DNA_END=952 /DNA_ORIENTATION=-
MGAACSQPETTVSTSPSSGGSDSEAWKPIHSACRWAKLPELKEKLNAKTIELADPDNGNRLVHIAAQNGHQEILELLVKNNCDVNAQNKKGQTALHMAVEYDYYWIARTLLDNGANGQIKNVDGHKAETGIEGQKKGVNACFAFTSAQSKKEVDSALDLILKQLEDNPESAAEIDKAEIVQAFMKHKKARPDEWTAEIDAKCKTVISKI